VKLLIEKDAAKRLARDQPKRREAILAALREIAADPFAHHANVKPMTGEADLFRLRHGDWRVIYRIVRTADEFRVLAVDTRGGVYK